MGKKYIIELNDECNSEFKGIMVFGLTQEKQISVELIPEEGLRPYTEDAAYAHGYTEAESKYREIRDELEKQAYQRGLADAWDAARKICTNWVLPDSVLSKIFGMDKTIDDIMKENTASEAIEKIQAYEQEKEEIKVGDEVEAVSGKAVIIEVLGNGKDVRYMYPDASTGFNDSCNVTRTGRHFPEIAEVLEKMRSEQDG